MSLNESTSPILVYQYIVLLDIGRAQADAWRPDTGPVASNLVRGRDVAVEARVVEYLKTPRGAARPDSLRLDLCQREPVDGWIADDYGPWSEIPLEKRPRLLAFAGTGPSPDTLARALAGDAVMLVTIPDPRVPFALEDVHRALSALQQIGHARVLESQQIRSAIVASRSRLGPLMGGFLLESAAGTSTFSEDDAFTYLVDLLGAADALPLFRKPILIGCVNLLAGASTTRAGWRVRLAKAMARILDEDPQNAAVLQQPIAQSYLRTTIFAPDWTPLIRSASVFADDRERRAFQAHLNRPDMAPETAQRLRAWSQ